MVRFLTKGQLHDLLRECGHAFSSAEPVDEPIDVSPPAETYLTVGLDADGSLKPAYRDRYFACLRDADDEPLILRAPAFALEGPFAIAAERDPGNNYFVMGPVRWLLARVRRFERALLWPRGGFRGDDGLGFIPTTSRGEPIDPAPRLASWFRRYVPEPARVAAAVLDLSAVADCQVVWEAANLVGVGTYDFFLAEPAGREVYQLHHHDKVVVSIPDAPARRDLLSELARQTDIFEDCSGYRSSAEEELFGG
ncbi:MAG: hypothetical protein J2P46_13070 [Zavarzinella sp.]|nr:hypothetical protein [Zavarzinella sp.]